MKKLLFASGHEITRVATKKAWVVLALCFFCSGNIGKFCNFERFLSNFEILFNFRGKLCCVVCTKCWCSPFGGKGVWWFHQYLWSDVPCFQYYISTSNTQLSFHVFVVISSINGNNGSFTNTDDHDIDHQNRKRINKEAYNKRFKKKVNVDKSSQPRKCREKRVVREMLAPPCLPGNESNRNIVDQLESLGVNNDEVDSQVSAKHKAYILDGVKFRNDNNHLVPIDGIHFEFIELPIDRYVIPNFRAFGKNFLREEVILSEYLYTYILSYLKVLPDEPRNFLAINSFVIQYLNIFPSDLIDGTVKFYMYKNSSRNLPNPGVSVVACALRVTMNSSSLYVKPVTVSIDPGFYRYNGNWAIVKSSGFYFDVGLDDRLERIGFNTSLPLLESDYNKRLLFCFSPIKAFQTYGKCALNVIFALSRYFKSEDTEELRVQNQFSALSGIYQSHIEPLATLCGASCVNDGADLVLNSKKVYKNKVLRKFVYSYTIPNINSHYSTSTFLRTLDGIVVERNIFDLILKLYESMLCLLGEIWNFILVVIYSPVYFYLDTYTVLSHYVRLPHPKRDLYISYVDKIEYFNKILHNDGGFKSKFKWEYGKVGKVGRLYATGEWLALADYISVDCLKFLFKKEIVVGSFLKDFRLITFSCQYYDCQESSKSDLMFREALSIPNDSVKLIFFSDDGFLVSNINGRFKLFETDISSCDASNGFPIFVALNYLASKIGVSENLLKLIEQCARPTRIVNPDDDNEYVVLQPKFYFEYSGSKLTTVLNNLASVLICCGIHDFCRDSPLHIDDLLTSENIVTAAFSVGYKLTVDLRSSWNSVTFLKRAFNLSHSWLVYGPILRSFGALDGIPRKEFFGLTQDSFLNSSYETLTEIHIQQWVLSLVNEPSSILLDALRVRAKLDLSKYDKHRVISLHDLQERYGGDDFEWYQLYDAVVGLRFGDWIHLPILEKIYKVDYGVTATEDFVANHEIYREKRPVIRRLRPSGLDKLV